MGVHTMADRFQDTGGSVLEVRLAFLEPTKPGFTLQI